MRRWITFPEKDLPNEMYRIVGGSRVVAQALTRRGLTHSKKIKSFLDPAFYSPSHASELKGVEIAVDLIFGAIQEGKRILVWGDFDVDGQTATTILVASLRQLGADVLHYIPVRAIESHGVHLRSLQKIIKSEKIGLLITCDTGITAFEPVIYAKNHNLDVIITDHHQPAEELPEADAVINPRLLPIDHPLATLPGVGVAYKLCEALTSKSDPSFDPQSFLDLTALGIVADVAELILDTRYLLQLGIVKLRKTERAGLQALFEQAEIIPENIDEELIAFGVAPRLNALGRLADANLIVDFLTTKDRLKAKVTAIELEALNARRKLLTDQVFAGALAQVDREPGLVQDPVLVLSHTLWPGGIIGIVASRLVEYFNKPVVLISTPPGELGRGSARSIPGLNITELFASQSQHLEGFGGHPMAAGFTIQEDKIPVFREGLCKSIIARQPSSESNQILIDSWIGLGDITIDLVQDIHRLAPFGAGNRPLIFATSDLEIVKNRQVGRNKEHTLVTVADHLGSTADVMWWQNSNLPVPVGRIDLAYTIRSTDYRGQPGIQISWVDYRIVETELTELAKPKKPITILDFRNTNYPEAKVKDHLETPETITWGEALEPTENSPVAFNRQALIQARRLIIWTIPPGMRELKEAIQRVSPEEVVLFSVDPRIDDIRSFMNKLIGLIKYAILHKDGQVNLIDLASATAHRVETVQAGLDWLSSQGVLEISQPSDEDNNTFKIQFNSAKLAFPSGPLVDKLAYLLEETAAFRKFYLRADANNLLGFEANQ
jgi:single-stranded-DNA-specific exonuclease